MADIKVFCTNSAVKDQLFSKIKSSLPSVPLFDSNYTEVVDTAGKLSKLVQEYPTTHFSEVKYYWPKRFFSVRKHVLD